MRLSQPSYLPTGYNYVITVLLDPTKEADGKTYKIVQTIFSPHPEKMVGFLPQEVVQIIQILGYQPTVQDLLNIIKASNSKEQAQEVDLNGDKGIYTTSSLEFVKNGSLISISADNSITKDQLIKIAQSFTEVQ